MRNSIFFWSVAFALIALVGIPSTASAGFMDKLNAATEKMNQATQKIQGGKPASPQPAEDPDRPLHLEDHYKGSCEGKRSATCMDYMELVDQCMDPLRGYRMKVTGDLIDKKLKKEKLTDQQRKSLEEDLAGIREAEKNKSDDPTIAGEEKSQRYLMDISDEDQVYINAEYNQYHNKIYNKCVGADHMNTGRRTEMITDKGMSGEEAVAEYRKEQAKKKEPMECMMRVQGVRYQIMADMMEKKMQAMKLSDKERSEWEADIAAVRKAGEAGGGAMPTVDDPANPYRPITRLTTTEEQMTLNEEYSKQSQALMAECTQKSKGPEKSSARGQSGGTTTSQMKAKLAEPKPVKKARTVGSGGSLSASLGATNLDYFERGGVTACYDPIKGHMAKVTADKLEAKLNVSKDVTGQKRKEWEEDIAAWKDAASVGADQPDPPDPDNPYRWQDYLTKEERQQINMEHSAFVNKITKECNAKDHMGG